MWIRDRNTPQKQKRIDLRFHRQEKLVPRLIGIFGITHQSLLLQTNADDLNGGKEFVARPSQPRK